MFTLRVIRKAQMKAFKRRFFLNLVKKKKVKDDSKYQQGHRETCPHLANHSKNLHNIFLNV